MSDHGAEFIEDVVNLDALNEAITALRNASFTVTTPGAWDDFRVSALRLAREAEALGKPTPAYEMNGLRNLSENPGILAPPDEDGEA